MTEQLQLALVRPDQAEQGLDRRGLAGAVWAEEPEDLTRVDLEAEPLHRDRRLAHEADAERLLEAAHLDHGLGGHPAYLPHRGSCVEETLLWSWAASC